MKSLILKLFGDSLTNPKLIDTIQQELSKNNFIIYNGRSLDINGLPTNPSSTNYWKCEILNWNSEIFNLNNSIDESHLIQLLRNVEFRTGIKIQYQLK